MCKRFGQFITIFVAAVLALPSCSGRQAQPAYDIAPVLINREEITRAMRSVGAGFEAEVVLLVRVDEEGYVRQVRLASSSGNEELDDAARWIGEQMRFEPARSGGDPVPALVRVPVNFDLVTRASYPPRLRNDRVVVNRIINEYPDLRGRYRVRVKVGPEGWILENRNAEASSDEVMSAGSRLLDDLTFWPAYRGEQRKPAWVILVIRFAGPETRIYIESTDT
ncbi:MAG: energy transducer TonB [Gemmatimonadetes bacterium]|uniref:Energy transducer TonB n=1 Tax=Candidatus Kutchimonas denitrificans TaxID=3056748 RepID=A0AAE5CCQ9_9BACT|nr:energy transducer TonB [Gemmatimonadota bacterium]NIR76293.1 energy transducer TonB [Candidatus Kutchimonas denitrificans]NIS02316.1 energy transducer TonB [Gemmatimonadota bacterium]NIT68135.1 energy transducer TonB [Gemmatimonadota bacterium]NIU54359.1 TonB family protein [Gemmatimonadota bacterium]